MQLSFVLCMLAKLYAYAMHHLVYDFSQRSQNLEGFMNSKTINMPQTCIPAEKGSAESLHTVSLLISFTCFRMVRREIGDGVQEGSRVQRQGFLAVHAGLGLP